MIVNEEEWGCQASKRSEKDHEFVCFLCLILTKAAFVGQKYSEIVKKFYYCFLVLIYLNVMYSCDGKAEFSATLLQSSV